MKLSLLLGSLSFLITACSTKVDSIDVSSSQGVAAVSSVSSLQLVENLNQNSAPSCSPRPAIKLVLTQNSARRLSCRDVTAKAQSLALGPVCPSGVSIQSFTADSAWRDCDQLTVCGQPPTTKTVLSQPGGAAIITQLMFDNLPWGCVGRVDATFTDQVAAAAQIKAITINNTPPPCPMCAATNSQTCAQCGADGQPPTITDVVLDLRVCNQNKVVVFASDAGSGLADKPYSFDGGQTWQAESSAVVAGVDIKVNAGAVRVRDRAGNVATYAKDTVGRSNCDCKLGSNLVPHGSTQAVFPAADSGVCGQPCVAGKVTCSLGVLTGDVGNTVLSCGPKVCNCTLPTGQALAQGAQKTLYKVSTLGCDTAATCDDPANKITVKCADPIANTLALISGGGDPAAFPADGCQKKSCLCVYLSTQMKPGDPPLKVYKMNKAVLPQRCAQVGNVGAVTCANVNGNFVLQGDNNPAVFKYTQCTDDTSSGSGDSDYNIGSGVGGGQGGGVGNDSGDGEGFKRRGKGGGSGCDVRYPPYYCFISAAKFSYRHGMCRLPTANGYASAPPSTQISQLISEGGTIVAFSVPQVACGDSCSNYSGVIRCEQTNMSQRDKYPYSTCREVCP